MIKLDSLEIGYKNSPIISPISLTIGKDEFVGVIGSNGGGKTTLIKSILGLVPKISGQIICSPNSSFGYVPQQKGFDKIFPISVLELVLMGRYGIIGFGKSISESDKQIAMECLEKVGIPDLANRIIRSLSGGEIQRALIARAVAGSPTVLVLDEPTASVDVKGESEIMDLVSEIKDEHKLTVIMVSHYISCVAKHADNLVLIDKQSGILEYGPAANVLNSESINQVFGMNITFEGKK